MALGLIPILHPKEISKHLKHLKQKGIPTPQESGSPSSSTLFKPHCERRLHPKIQHLQEMAKNDSIVLVLVPEIPALMKESFQIQ